MDHVSYLTIAFLGVFIILNLASYVLVYRFMKKRIRMSFQPVLIGIASYMLFGYFGYALIAALIGQNEFLANALGNNAALSLTVLEIVRYALELFSVVGGVWYLYRSYRKGQTEYHAGDIIMFALGIMLARYVDSMMIPNVSSLTMAIGINQQGLDAVLASLNTTDEATAELMRESLLSLESTSAWEYFVDGISSILHFFVTIAASLGIYGVYKREMPKPVIFVPVLGILGFYLFSIIELIVTQDLSCFIRLVIELLVTVVIVIVTYQCMKKYMSKELYILTYTAKQVSEERIAKAGRSMAEMAAVPKADQVPEDTTDEETPKEDAKEASAVEETVPEATATVTTAETAESPSETQEKSEEKDV